MNRKDNNTASLVVIVGVMIGLAMPSVAPARAAEHGKATDKPKASKPSLHKDKARPIILIKVDEEAGAYLKSAEKKIARKDYAGAIEVLQALLDRAERCFMPTDDPRRFVSLATKVNEVIGQLPPEGVELYRRLYDARAERLFRTAAERLDEAALRDIIRRYFHTSYGGDALDLLGSILFDRGEFSQAAQFWRETIHTHDGGESATLPAGRQVRNRQSAMVLAKVAVAYHLAGESTRAAEAMNLLAERYPKTRATIGGREQNVADFARRVLSKPAPVVGTCLQHDWPCLAGAPDSVAVMSPCRPVPSPRWTAPGGKLAENPNIRGALSTIPLASGRDMMLASVSLREGQVTFTHRYGWQGKKARQVVMSALIHPVVVGKTVLYRAAGGIVAHDLLSGEKLWETLAFPLYRPADTRRYRVFGFPTVEERGHWTLTAGAGKVFAVGKFFPYSTLYYYLAGGGPHSDNGDVSTLAAFSVAAGGRGRPLWMVGMGEGNTDLLRGGKFLTAPTYAPNGQADGRVYAFVEYKRAHHLVCLNAENGRLVWDTMLGQTKPVLAFSCRRVYWQRRTGPPAVADGRVFVTSNVGAIFAFEAGTGRPLWAYQYDSNINRSWMHRRPGYSGLPYPPNPIVVTKGRVICLPADGDKLLALRADTGKLDWSADRRGQRDLTAMDSSRLLLSGEGIRIIDATTGKEVWTDGKITGIHGRPAVTTDAILASGKGEIIRVSLKDFSITHLPVKQRDAILGNLICVNGKLLAANAAGVSAYFPAASTRNTQE